MIVAEIFENVTVEAVTRAWSKSPGKATLKYRCTTGPRNGQTRASAAACMAPINIKKSATLKRTKAKGGGNMKVKSAKTKRTNPTSKRVARMNAGSRRNKI